MQGRRPLAGQARAVLGGLVGLVVGRQGVLPGAGAVLEPGRLLRPEGERHPPRQRQADPECAVAQKEREPRLAQVDAAPQEKVDEKLYG